MAGAELPRMRLAEAVDIREVLPTLRRAIGDGAEHPVSLPRASFGAWPERCALRGRPRGSADRGRGCGARGNRARAQVR